jgi:uncharacterized membrane protein YbaN (DUF454 family)
LRLARPLWVLAGVLAVGLGGLGVVVPGLPTTVFFIVAAWCFSKSSPRLEQWVLDLPGVGPMVRDHRAGLGMPAKAKVIAITMIVGFSAFAVLVIGSWLVRAIVVGAALVGVLVVSRQPTKR